MEDKKIHHTYFVKASDLVRPRPKENFEATRDTHPMFLPPFEATVKCPKGFLRQSRRRDWETTFRWTAKPYTYKYTIVYIRRTAKIVRDLRHRLEKEFGCKVSFKIKKHHSKL